MMQLTLTSDQVALLSGSDSSMLVCGADGHVVGVLAKTVTAADLKNAFSADEIAAADREYRQTTARRTTQEILDRLPPSGPQQ